MTRLKYIKSAFSALIMLDRCIVCNNKMVHVDINTETLVYRIYENVTNKIVEAQGTSLADCKRKVKRDLINLGAVFNQEIRNRGKTEKL